MRYMRARAYVHIMHAADFIPLALHALTSADQSSAWCYNLKTIDRSVRNRLKAKLIIQPNVQVSVTYSVYELRVRQAY